MPRRSAVKSLPKGIKAELDHWLEHKDLAGYRELSDWLAEKGYSISKSSLQRYGSEFEQKTEKLRAATQMSITLANEMGDDAGAMNDALIRMVQGELFELLLKADHEGKELVEALPEITLAVSRLTRASVTQKKWQTEYIDRAAEAAEEVSDIARKAGLSDEVVDRINRKILGVAG